MDAVNAPQIGIVVPTLGTRPEYLIQALRSIRSAGNCHVVVVAPDPETIRNNFSPDLIDQIIQDPKSGLAEAINLANTPLRATVGDRRNRGGGGDDPSYEFYKPWGMVGMRIER